MSTAPRIPPVPPRQWSDEAREAVSILSEHASQAGLDPSDETRMPNLTCTQLQHPELMKSFFPFIKYLLWEGKLEARYRELAILRVAWLRQAEYEWTQHVLIGREAGLTDVEISRVIEGSGSEQWDPVEASAISAVDQLLESASLTDDTWDTLLANLGVEQLIELIHVIGNYDLIAMFMNATGLELEEGMGSARFSCFSGS